MSAAAEMVSMVNDIRIGFDRGQGTLGEVRDRVMEIARRVIAEETQVVEPKVTYEVRERNITTGAVGPYSAGGTEGLKEFKHAARVAVSYNDEERDNAVYERRPIRSEYIVVKATTNYEEVTA